MARKKKGGGLLLIVAAVAAVGIMAGGGKKDTKKAETISANTARPTVQVTAKTTNTPRPTATPVPVKAEAPVPDARPEQYDYVLNTNTKKFHKPSCSSVSKMKSKNRKDFTGTREEVIAKGYEPCGKCNP